MRVFQDRMLRLVMKPTRTKVGIYCILNCMARLAMQSRNELVALLYQRMKGFVMQPWRRRHSFIPELVMQSVVKLLSMRQHHFELRMLRLVMETSWVWRCFMYHRVLWLVVKASLCFPGVIVKPEAKGQVLSENCMLRLVMKQLGMLGFVM